MRSQTTTFALCLGALATLPFLANLAAAQATTNLTQCCDVAPATIDQADRLAWCRAQTNTCPLLCSNGQTTNNTCDSNALTYSCICFSGTTPNVSSYGQTLPSLECDAWRQQCIAAHPNDINGQKFCLSFVCGNKNASAEGAGASTSSSAPSATAAGSGTVSASQSVATPTKTGGAAQARMVAVRVGREVGTAGVVVGVLALFGLAL